MESSTLDLAQCLEHQRAAHRADPYADLEQRKGHLAALRRLSPAGTTAQLRLLMDVVDGRRGQGVADPYYGDEAGFETTWSDVDTAAAALVERLR